MRPSTRSIDKKEHAPRLCSLYIHTWGRFFVFGVLLRQASVSDVSQQQQRFISETGGCSLVDFVAAAVYLYVCLSPLHFHSPLLLLSLLSRYSHHLERFIFTYVCFKEPEQLVATRVVHSARVGTALYLYVVCHAMRK